MHPMLTIAVKAARRAGSVINRAAQNLDIVKPTEKGVNDFVSEVDRAAEAAIIRVLHEAYPSHAILAEESGASDHAGADKSEYRWIIDPLDGTTNFLHGFPQYAVSIALEHRGVLAQGVIYDPVKNDLFTATRGRGAYLNDRRIRVSKRTQLKGCLIGTGFPFKEFTHVDPYLAMFKTLTQETAGIRRAGSAALDLAYVAAGFLDGFWEFGLARWDIAAGALMIIEAGGHIGDLEGKDGHLDSGNVVAATPKVFPELLAALQPHLTPALKSKAA